MSEPDADSATKDSATEDSATEDSATEDEASLATAGGTPKASASLRENFRSMELDGRLLGMLGVMALIWFVFHLLSADDKALTPWTTDGGLIPTPPIWKDGTFLTPRNIWNLSVQTAAVAIMATGMVLVIVSRNIDLSVGSMLAAIGMAMALLQAEILPDLLGFDHWALWIIAITAGILFGAAIGGFQGAIVAYGNVPSFIVTLGGLLVWRGVAWWMASGRTIAPMEATFQRIGGTVSQNGTIGGPWTWFVGLLGCVAVVFILVNNRRQKTRYGFQQRPTGVDIAIGVLGCAAILGIIWFINRVFVPEGLQRQRAEAAGEVYQPGIEESLGLAIPVLIVIGVATVVWFIATRLRFGRYIYAIGGNPEAAELGGINTRWTIVKTFALMGVLVAIAAAVQIGRLNSAVSGLGETTELAVIAAAVIGGTSLAGGVGTIPGAVLGAVLMQSLRSGMVLLGVDAPLQEIVVGIVLVAAVAIDANLRRGST